jgi:hypothetical protein
MQGLKMSKKKRLNKSAKKSVEVLKRRRIARKTKRVLFLLSTLLLLACLVLVFKIGEPVWPAWIIAHRRQMIGFLFLSIVLVITSSPLIIEMNSNPRPLSTGSDGPPGPI